MSPPFAAAAAIIYWQGRQSRLGTPPEWPPPVIRPRQMNGELQTGSVSNLTFTDGVEVVYGVTKLTADKLTVDLAARRGVATGHVHIVDPDAVIDAEEVEFQWDPAQEFGHLENLDGRFEGLAIRSKLTEFTKSKLILEDVEFKSAQWRSLYRLKARRLTYVQGKYTRLEHPSYRILGIDIPWHKSTTFSQDPRTPGPALPAISYSHGAPGLNYSPSAFTDSQTLFQSWLNLYEGALPHYGFELAHTFLKPSVTDQSRIVPPSDLDTRFGLGYFDNIKMPSPAAEFQAENKLRSTLAGDTDLNQGSNDRLPGGAVSKLGEIMYGVAGPMGPLAEISNIRFQSARQQGQTAFTTRFEFDTSIGVPPIKLLPNLDSALRFDAQGYAGDRLFGWARAQLGLSVNPVKPVRISAAYVTAAEMGTPDLSTDALYNNGAWCFRADATFKSFQASYLLRYYLNGIFFDNEYQIAQSVGAFRFFVTYRTFPSDFRFGISFRMDDILDSIKRHHQPPAR